MSNYFHQGTACPLTIDNVDTDQIIPKQFLTGITREGFGEALFYDWRYQDDGTKNPEFVLNLPQYEGVSVLIAGHNFGCGSSREHAPWALSQFGFKVIIATSFADIFYRNCINNKVLPARVSTATLQELKRHCAERAETLCIDLAAQHIVMDNERTFNFMLDDTDREQLLDDRDFIGMAEQYADAIDRYEDQRATEAPWFMPASFAI